MEGSIRLNTSEVGKSHGMDVLRPSLDVMKQQLKPTPSTWHAPLQTPVTLTNFHRRTILQSRSPTLPSLKILLNSLFFPSRHLRSQHPLSNISRKPPSFRASESPCSTDPSYPILLAHPPPPWVRECASNTSAPNAPLPTGTAATLPALLGSTGRAATSSVRPSAAISAQPATASTTSSTGSTSSRSRNRGVWTTGRSCRSGRKKGLWPEGARAVGLGRMRHETGERGLGTCGFSLIKHVLSEVQGLMI